MAGDSDSISADLERRLLKLNLQNRLLSIAMVPAAVLAWLLSYSIAAGLSYWVFSLLDCEGSCLAWLPTLLIMGVLVVETVRHTRNALAPDDPIESEALDFVVSSGLGIYPLYGPSGNYAIWIVEILLLAPNVTRLIFTCHRAVVHYRPEDVQHAAAIVWQLLPEKLWVPAEKFHVHRAGWEILGRLGILSTSRVHGEAVVSLRGWYVRQHC